MHDGILSHISQKKGNKCSRFGAMGYVSECARLWLSVPEYARLCVSVPDSVRVCLSVPDCDRVCPTVPECVRLCLSVPECARLCLRVSECVRGCPTVTDCAQLGKYCTYTVGLKGKVLWFCGRNNFVLSENGRHFS